MISHSAQRTRKPLGLILYSGPSEFDSQPIVCIATGFRNPSANAKTGKNMIQTWILRRDHSPLEAVHSGEDGSVCGDCPLRGIIEKRPGSQRKTVNRWRSCYVNLRTPQSVYKAYRRGRYQRLDLDQHLGLYSSKVLRLGSYGEIVSLPRQAVLPLIAAVDGHCGYTHMWQDARFSWSSEYCMASVHSRSAAEEATSLGFRYFRVAPVGESPLKNEVRCPASAEAGRKLTCDRCRLCSGIDGNPARPNVMINVHGSPAVLSSYRRVIGEN